jgi:hypothetical protein
MKATNIPGLTKMLEDMASKSVSAPWVSPEEARRIKDILSRYENNEFASDFALLNSLREEFYSVYQEYQDRLKIMEKYTSAWESGRKVRDLYFKFLNIPTLFLIGTRDTSFDAQKMAQASEGV